MLLLSVDKKTLQHKQPRQNSNKSWRSDFAAWFVAVAVGLPYPTVAPALGWAEPKP
ncbi:unnamed protein product [Haemonchus placei]|uniref:Uncharacterized protein n=1 Tax=Haemonchus placei TaxID=6290 RepID=A0A3P7SSP1_HAEPC|nr:unnamed protein product [Haemonchus placei]